MAERRYEVFVTQRFELAHVVRAASKKEARAIILELTLNRIERDDPRIVETYETGRVGSEEVSRWVERVD